MGVAACKMARGRFHAWRYYLASLHLRAAPGVLEMRYQIGSLEYTGAIVTCPASPAGTRCGWVPAARLAPPATPAFIPVAVSMHCGAHHVCLLSHSTAAGNMHS